MIPLSSLSGVILGDKDHDERKTGNSSYTVSGIFSRCCFRKSLVNILYMA